MQRQAAPVTLVHMPKEQSQEGEAGGYWDEEQRTPSSRENGPPVPGRRNEGFPAGSVFDTPLPPKNGEGNGDGFNEAGSQMREETSQQTRQDLGHHEEKGCLEWEV